MSTQLGRTSFLVNSRTLRVLLKQATFALAPELYAADSKLIVPARSASLFGAVVMSSSKRYSTIRACFSNCACRFLLYRNKIFHACVILNLPCTDE